MAEGTVYTSAKLTVTRDTVTGDVTIEVLDRYRQSHHRFVVPDHLVRSLVDTLSDVIERRPELFPATHTRLIP